MKAYQFFEGNKLELGGYQIVSVGKDNPREI